MSSQPDGLESKRDRITHFPGFTQFNCALSDEEKIYTSLNHHAENRYHPNIRNVESEKTARNTDWNGVLVVRSPTCISPTRSINMTRLQILRSTARIPQGPNGNHDQKTDQKRGSVSDFFFSFLEDQTRAFTHRNS